MHLQCRTLATSVIRETRMIQSPTRKTIFDCNNNYYTKIILYLCVRACVCMCARVTTYSVLKSRQLEKGVDEMKWVELEIAEA